jgi:hypothetical protein
MQEEQNKFKDGDRVTCCINGMFIEDGVISIEKDGRPFICQNYQNGNNATDKKGYKYSWVLNKDFTQTYVTNLKLKEEKKVIDYSVGVEEAMDFKVGYKVLIKTGSSHDSVTYHGNEGIIVSTKYSPWSDSYYKQKNTDYYYMVKLLDGTETTLWGNDFDILEPGYESEEYKQKDVWELTKIGINYWDLVDKSMCNSWIGSTGTSTYTAPVFTPIKKRVNFFID